MLFQVRTKGSIKRRPPSRRFRRSQSDCGDLADLRAPASSQENGAKEENGDEVFPPHSEALGSPPPGEGPAGAREKPPLRRTSSRAERQEKGQAVDDAQPPQKAVGGSDKEASPRPATGEAVPPGQASNPEAENGRRSPTEGKEETEKREAKEATAAKEDDEPRQSRDAAGSAEGAAGEAPAGPPRGAEVPHIPEQGKGEEKDEAGAVLEPGCCPSEEAPETEVSGLHDARRRPGLECVCLCVLTNQLSWAEKRPRIDSPLWMVRGQRHRKGKQTQEARETSSSLDTLRKAECGPGQGVPWGSPKHKQGGNRVCVCVCMCMCSVWEEAGEASG